MGRRLFADDNNKDGDNKRFSMVLLGEAVNGIPLQSCLVVNTY